MDPYLTNERHFPAIPGVILFAVLVAVFIVGGVEGWHMVTPPAASSPSPGVHMPRGYTGTLLPTPAGDTRPETGGIAYLQPDHRG